MNYETYKRYFTEKALENGYSYENIQKCLDYSRPLIEKGLPPIYDVYNLSGLVGYNSMYISRALRSTKFFYRKFEIKKKNGGTRVICEPLPSLKEIQYWILNEILYKCKVSKYSKAYIPKKNIREHLRYHTKEKQVLTLDFENFFTSIKKRIVFDFFFNLGYSTTISEILSSICTLDGSLPQGAPTSPYLSNLILKTFDENIAKFCFDQKIKFSRYADDLAFSGESIDIHKILDVITKEIQSLGLHINKTKTLLMKSNVKQIISGIVVNEKMQVPKNKRNELRNIMFYIKKFGIENHLKTINETRGNYLLHILGKINYILAINPNDTEFAEYKTYLGQLYNNYITEDKLK